MRAMRSVLLTVGAGVLVAAAVIAPARAASEGVPLGDGRASTSGPQAGWVYACQLPSRPAAAHTGPWISGGLWYPDIKPAVQGAVAWPQAQVTAKTSGAKRTIVTNGVPVGSTTGTFPIATSDPVYQYDRNPNAITATATTVRVPADPSAATKPSCLPMGAIGFATNGVAIYNALDDDSLDAVAHEMQDSCDGHPQGRGQYHYHGGSRCLVQSATASSTLYGYALDGFGIYVERDAGGRLLTNADLDECHGRTSVVDWNGTARRMYHYVVTQEYPYTLGCYRGTPAVSRPSGAAQSAQAAGQGGKAQRPSAQRPSAQRPSAQRPSAQARSLSSAADGHDHQH